MEERLTEEVKNNLQVLDRILKYINPVTLLQVSNYCETRETEEESIDEILSTIQSDIKLAKSDIQSNRKLLMRECLFTIIAGSLKLIEKLDKENQHD